ncbi:hypothetical protein DH2020_004574 [Rehmannia glutinosa]|uniref:C2 domain-containing protein n=1 Tax=Rehmannia glutinosa TaxID=99300 RepID=A0ABR0XPR1_REHGL
MRTYATAWMHPNRKLSSSVDTEGNNNPTWNDKFVFRVDEEFLRQDTSAVMIEIYAVHWFRDVLVGTVRVLVGNLIPPPSRTHHNGQHYTGMRFVALQIRRPSGRPQGILNIGVALLDSSMRSMPLYRQLSMSAVGIRDLMEDPPSLQQKENDNNKNNNNQASNVKPILRRTRSERSEHIAFDHFSPNSSIVAVKSKIGGKESSILSITDSVVPINGMRKIGKASSVISGAELREKPKHNGKKGKGGSVLSDSILSKESSNFRKMERGGAVMAERKYPLDDNQSSVLDGWSLDESVEGLRSKLERWRMELPPLYDRGFSSSSYKSSGRHARRHTEGSSGLFSCFGNIFGYECQCICGKPPGKRNVSARFHSPSTLTPGRSFL